MLYQTGATGHLVGAGLRGPGGPREAAHPIEGETLIKAGETEVYGAAEGEQAIGNAINGGLHTARRNEHKAVNPQTGKML